MFAIINGHSLVSGPSFSTASPRRFAIGPVEDTEGDSLEIIDERYSLLKSLICYEHIIHIHVIDFIASNSFFN